MDHARLEGIYEMALDLGKGDLQRLVGDHHQDTAERMRATALLVALDEHQLTAADVAAFAQFVAQVIPPTDHDWSEEAPIVPRLEAAYAKLEAYFRETDRIPPWLLIPMDTVPF